MVVDLIVIFLRCGCLKSCRSFFGIVGGSVDQKMEKN
jgi:hypothetical protein